MSEKKAFSIQKYIALTKGNIMEDLTFRVSTITSIAGNLLYLIVIYFLWKAIYASSPTPVVNGMTFYDTMIYLVLASGLFNVMNSFIVWYLGNDFKTGQIVSDLIKPMDYQVYKFFKTSGDHIISFFTTFVPTFIIVFLITHGSIKLGVNLLYFLLSVILATIINFCVDFTVGTICFFTQSIWGINIVKEVVVALLSGATIPLAFFSPGFRAVVNWLPFQAIYNAPLQILIGKSFSTGDYLSILCNQLFWVVAMLLLSKGFWMISKRVITVNGG
jgi:ABC-2 type transport system permease protein